MCMYNRYKTSITNPAANITGLMKRTITSMRLQRLMSNKHQLYSQQLCIMNNDRSCNRNSMYMNVVT